MWLKLLSFTRLRLATLVADNLSASSVKKGIHISFSFSLNMASGIGFPVGGASSSHRGYGFALGHPRSQSPSRTAPLRTPIAQRANSTGQRHGSVEHGLSPGTGNARDREPRRRDRSASASNMVGDPVQQATAYRLAPAGPQEAESIQDV